jgi:hypothetical protein
MKISFYVYLNKHKMESTWNYINDELYIIHHQVENWDRLISRLSKLDVKIAFADFSYNSLTSQQIIELLNTIGNKCKILTLTHCELTDKNIIEICKFIPQHLTLNLSYNNITELGANYLLDHTKNTIIDLNGNYIKFDWIDKAVKHPRVGNYLKLVRFLGYDNFAGDEDLAKFSLNTMMQNQN